MNSMQDINQKSKRQKDTSEKNSNKSKGAETMKNTVGLFIAAIFALMTTGAVQAETLTVDPNDNNNYDSIQTAINNAGQGDIISLATGTYPETLDMKGKSLTIDGDGIGSTIIDASSLTGYAISNFGNQTTFKNVTLKGTADDYGFKISHVSDITLENIKVEDSEKTGIDLNTVDNATLSNIEVVNTPSGFGIMMLDSTNIDVTDITTSGNAWGGVSIHAVDADADTITFSGTFDAAEDVPLLLEQDPPYAGDFVNLDLPDKFGYVVYGERNPSTEGYRQWIYKETLIEAKTFANGMLSSSDTYADMLIYDVAEENYHVISGMSIRTAINNAGQGETINVAGGTY